MNSPSTQLATHHWPAFIFQPQPRPADEPEPHSKFTPRNKGLTDMILAYLDEHPGSYATVIAKDLDRGPASVATSLDRLQKAHRVRSAEGDEYSRGGFLMKKWWRCDQ